MEWLSKLFGKDNASVLETRNQTLSESKKRLIKMLIIVTDLFGLLWFPINLQRIIYSHSNAFTKISKRNFVTITSISFWIGISSCAVNPFIYYYFNNDFKSEAIRYWNYINPWFKLNQKIKDKNQNNSYATNANTSNTEYDMTEV